MKTADTAYINGRVYTADKEFSIRSAFALSGDRFIAAGSDEEIRALCSSQTKIIDLKGRTVLPGLIDSHLHINNTGIGKYQNNGKTKVKVTISDYDLIRTQLDRIVHMHCTYVKANNYAEKSYK